MDASSTEPPSDRYVARDPSRPRILVADDEPDIRNLLVSALRGFGYEIISASNGTELLAKAGCRTADGEPAEQRMPDVIIADIRMPGATGLDALAAVRQRSPHTPVVLITALADHRTRARASELGVDAFFAKPFDVQELVNAVVSLAPTPTEDRGD